MLLAYIERHAVPLLSKIVARPAGRSINVSPGGDDPMFAIAAFVSDTLTSDPIVTPYIENIVKGSMLSTAVYLWAEGDVERRFERTDLYLDTPVLLKLLGHEGLPAQEAIGELVSAARRSGAHPAVFEHTVREARNVLHSVEQELRMAGRPQVVRGVLAHYAALGAQPSDLLAAAGRIERDIAAAGVSLMPVPPHKERFTVDEPALEAELREHLRYTGPSAALYDMKSLAAIHRIRAGRDADQLERTRAVLVTNNAALVTVAARFFRLNEQQGVGPAVVDHELATRLWLKSPMKAPDLPRAQILADSLALLSPDDAVWHRYLDEIERLQARGEVTADDVIELRFSTEAHRALVVATGNNPARVGPDVVRETLQRTREAAGAEDRAAREAAQVGEAEALKKAGAAAGEIGRLESKISTEQTMVHTLARDLELMKQQQRYQRDFIEERARKFATRVVLALTWVVVLLSLGAIGTALVADQLPGRLLFVLGIAGLAVSAIGVISQSFGGSVRGFLGRLEPRIAKHRERALLKDAGLLGAPEVAVGESPSSDERGRADPATSDHPASAEVA